jgi:L-rhamnose isomerase/sugar isomerase
MSNLPISAELIAEANARDAQALEEDYAALGRKLSRTGIDIDAIKDRVAGFSVAVPSWGAGRGGTRFAKFPIAGEPRNAARFAAFSLGQGERLQGAARRSSEPWPGF